jgi:phosphoribosylformylglycinamidine synthase
MWSFSEVIDGMAEACRALGTPVVSGNVSFYNETEGRGILPTPVIGMIGLVEDVKRVVQPGFKNEGDIIGLLGVTQDDLAASEYAAVNQPSGGPNKSKQVPRLNLELERTVQAATLEAAEAGLLQSAHDISDGGLAVALAESCFSSLNRQAVGTEINLTGSLSTAALLFSESPSRIIVSFGGSELQGIKEIANRLNCPFTVLGRVGGESLRISVDGTPVIDVAVIELEKAWRASIPRKLQTELTVDN